MDYLSETPNETKNENMTKLGDEKPLTNPELNTLHPSRVSNSPNEDETRKKISSLKHFLEKDLRAADLKWSFFVAATNTYKYDSCLKPFPPMYIKNECKDIESLRRTIELIPPLSVILKELDEPDVYVTYGPAVDLLHWVLIRLRDPYIKSISKDSYETVLRKVPSEMSVAVPNLIFQIVNVKQSSSEERWKTIAQGHSTFFAYHGSRLENFHSIIHYGLQQNMCKKSLFGKGIYLSSELGVSLLYSPVGYGWGGSALGSETSCVALCELINHPDVKSGAAEGGARRAAPDSVGGKVPNKYYLVTNSELVRIRYLLVYSQENQGNRYAGNGGLLAWFKQHKLLTFVLGYVVLLASVGLMHNKQVEKYYKSLVQRVGLE